MRLDATGVHLQLLVPRAIASHKSNVCRGPATGT